MLCWSGANFSSNCLWPFILDPGSRNTPATFMFVCVIVYNCKIGSRQSDQVRGNQYSALLVTGDRCHWRLSTNFKFYHYQLSRGSRGLAMSRSGHTSPWLMVTLHSGNDSEVMNHKLLKPGPTKLLALCVNYSQSENQVTIVGIFGKMDLFVNWK